MKPSDRHLLEMVREYSYDAGRIVRLVEDAYSQGRQKVGQDHLGAVKQCLITAIQHLNAFADRMTANEEPKAP